MRSSPAQKHSTLMQRLPQLVVLHLRDIIPSQAAAKHLAAMPSLHNLELYVAEEDSERLAQLPCRLTSLTVTRQARMEDMLRPTLPPQMPALVHLQQLELVDCSLAPAQLGSMTSLKILCLDSCTLLPCVDDGGTYHRKLSSPAAVTGFLNAIRQLTYLRHLELEDLHLDVAGLPAEQWSALTASTQLTRLMLHGEGHSPRLPAGAVQQMFSVGRRLPHLRKLILQFNGYQCQDSWCLDSGDLHSIIGGCPQLHSLCLLRTVCKGADVSALLQLPASCTRLVIGGNAFAHSAVPVVLQLTQLRKLRWWDSTPFNDRTLLQLTTLTHLSKLEIMCSDDVSTSIWEAAGVETPCSDDTITLCTDTKGPVWAQLKQLCMHSLDCVTAMLDEERAEHDDTRQQLADREAEVQQLQQQLANSEARWQAEVQLMQQQLAATSGGRHQEQL